MRKKAQVKMIETIFVLIIFFFLIIGAISFFSGQGKQAVEEKIREFGALDSVKTAQLAMFMPELQCSITNSKNCIDLLKAEAFEELRTNSSFRTYYYDYFKNANISIEYLDENGVEQSITLYDIEPEDDDYKLISPFYIPMVVFNPKTNMKYFGILTVKKII